MRPSQPITFFALWPSTRRYHHTTTHPELFCAAIERSAVATTASGQPGAPNWPYGRGAQQCLPQGCRAWDWPTHPFLTVFQPQNRSCPMPFMCKVYRGGGWVWLSGWVYVHRCGAVLSIGPFPFVLLLLSNHEGRGWCTRLGVGVHVRR